MKTGIPGRLLALLLALVMVIAMLPLSAVAEEPTATYTKVTAAPEDGNWAGEYLIVYENSATEAYVLNSSLEKIDAASNYQSLAIKDGSIEAAEKLAVAIDKDGYIRSSSGYYIYKDEDANGLLAVKTPSKAAANTFALNTDSTVNIIGSGGAYFRFNKNSDQMRFRYFKTATYTKQQPITLYKKTASTPTRESGIVTDLTTLKEGDKVVIFNPKYLKALSSEYTGYYNKGTDVTLTEGKLADFVKENLWTLTKNEDGTYTIATADGGKKFSMDTTNGSTPLDKVNDKWELNGVEGKEGYFYLENAGRKANRDNNYRLEWYDTMGNWSTYKGTGDLYEQQFYYVAEQDVPKDPDPGEPDPEEPATVSIKTALDGATNTEFTVKGVVTLVDGQNIYLQDATGGICLRLSSKTTEIALGDTIIGTGKRAVYNNLPQLGSGTFVKSSGLTLAAKPTTIGALTADNVCTYVKLTGLEVTNIYDKDGTYTNPNITFKDADGKTIQLYKAVINKVDGAWEYKVGDVLDVTAAVGTNNGTLQLRNTTADEIKVHGTINDPITDDMIPEGAMTVKEAGEITAKTENVTVIGQVVYHYGNAYKGAASINSIILEDVIEGEIYGFQVYDYTNYAKYVVGDVVKITGTVEPYNGVPQMKNPTMEVVKNGVEPIPAQEITVSQLGDAYLSEYVYIKDITLGTYNADGNTPVTDATGNANLYKGVPLPAGATEADVTGLYACCSKFKTTWQLRNGASSDYVTNLTPPETGDLPEAGDQVVIYSKAAEGVLGAENDTKSILNVAAVIENDKAIPENGAVIFTVERNGDYYRFKSEAYGYLCSNGTGNNAFYSKDFSGEGESTEDADWLVRTCSGGVGGFEMESRKAKYSGHSQWLEYFSDSYKTYSMYSKTGDLDYTIYSFNFYPVAEGVNVEGGLVIKPTITFPETMLDAYLGMHYEFTLDIDTIYPIDDPWTEYSIKLADGTYIPGISELQSDTDVEVLDGFVSGKGKVHITVWAEDIAKAAQKGDYLILTFAFKDTKGYEAKASYKVTIKDEPVIENLSPRQGEQTLDNKRPVISADVINAGENPTVELKIDEVAVSATYADGKVTYTPAEDLTDGRKTVTLTVTRADGKSVTKTWSFVVGEAQYQLYFGQLHSHTQYSDGAGTLESALDYIKQISEEDNVQFVAFTDHSNYFDGSNAGGSANPEGALYDMSLANEASQKRWNEFKASVENFNKANAGSMVALGGFEMTWSGGPGHINTFNTPGIVSRNNTTLNNKTSDAGMKAYYSLLSKAEGAESISQFNHPGTTFGNFSDFSYWDAVIDTRMYLVEVGNGEGQIGAGGYYPSYEQYIMALDKGWHVAPSNNQDNHKGRWGNANAARDVIITDDFSEQGIYEAIRARRVYATEDKNLEINYTVNGLMMGSSISEVPEKLNIAVSVYDPDKTDSITKVEVVVNSGKTAYTWDDPAELATGNLTCELDPDYSYYFIRVTEGDGDLAVTAPVWVGETLKLGISNFVCGTATPVTNEKLTLTTTLFNSEAMAATVKSLTYTVGSEVLGSDLNEHVITASSTLDVTFDWTPTKAKVTTVTVTAVVEQDGKEYTFTKQIDLDVLDADSLVYIGIDASHYNEYVAGNYKDSMGNFGNLAAKYSVRTVQLNTSKDLIAACTNPKYKALILTAPSRRLEAAQKDPKTYSAEELAAIQKFNANGGTVVLAGWSDNYENFDVIKNNPAIKHMAATQNEVLEALGSSLRISDDATYDDERSAADGVDKWRLYFSTYNMDNFLLDRVEVDEAHPFDKLYTERFSHYGGASIYAVDANGTPTSTLPSTVSPVVYGHATTYSVDVDGDGLGGNSIPKYAYADGDNRLMVMASEQLEGKGLIVVSGAAFMSNFEVQASISDNGSEKNYSNYKICENLINYLNPVKITPIAEVQAQEEDGIKYTIDGIVTSNASGFDASTAFFDCIYVQDKTAGINAFPVAGNYKIGDKVRITGTTSSYQGERQIAVTSIEKLGEETPVTPKKVTAADLENKGNLGSLVTVEGTATKIEYAEGLIQTIMVKDDSGKEARIFIDGYITTAEDVKNATVGCHVVATGLASYDNTFVLKDGTPVYQRIRIRNRADVVCTADTTPPTGKITVDQSAWDKFLTSITFGLYFGEKQTVTIDAADNSGLDVTIEYYVDEAPTETPLTKQELEAKNLTAYTKAFEIKPDGKFVVYAKLTDQTGNVTWLSTDGIVLDATAPVITGAENGKTYCAAVNVTINELYIKTVTLNGKAVELDENNGLKILPAEGEQTLEVTDEAGNKTTLTLTVNDGHTPEEDDGDCTTEVRCKFCGEVTTAAKEHDFTGEWKHDAEGHWHECKNDGCTKHSEKEAHTFEWITDQEATSKKAGVKHEECKTCGLKQNENTVIPATKTPKTGDSSNLMLWISLMILSAGTVFAVIFGKKKSKANK